MFLYVSPFLPYHGMLREQYETIESDPTGDLPDRLKTLFDVRWPGRTFDNENATSVRSNYSEFVCFPFSDASTVIHISTYMPAFPNLYDSIILLFDSVELFASSEMWNGNQMKRRDKNINK